MQDSQHDWGEGVVVPRLEGVSRLRLVLHYFCMQGEVLVQSPIDDSCVNPFERCDCEAELNSCPYTV